MAYELTEQRYAARIPKWCGARTIEEHKDMMLCWSLCEWVQRGEYKHESTCRNCMLYQPTSNRKTAL